jgi:hypothetical protein
MAKYNVEGGIDFYTELYKTFDDAEDDQQEQVCLITNETLTDRHFKMNCGHTFNYVPLYKDIVNHKTKFNVMESSVGKSKKNEIRCPYCRDKQTGVLPYYEDLGLPLIEGVNVYTPYVPPPKCQFVYDNEDFDVNLPEHIIENPKVFFCCYSGNKTVLPNVVEPHFYCTKHKKIVVSKSMKELKLKAKEDKKKAVEAKQQLKLKAKEDKLKAKEEKNTNVIIQVEQNPLLCVEILKSGERKGHQCNVGKLPNQDRCKRHYNMLIAKHL